MTHSLVCPPRVLPSTPAASLRITRCSLPAPSEWLLSSFWLLPVTSGLCRAWGCGQSPSLCQGLGVGRAPGNPSCQLLWRLLSLSNCWWSQHWRGFQSEAGSCFRAPEGSAKDLPFPLPMGAPEPKVSLVGLGLSAHTFSSPHCLHGPCPAAGPELWAAEGCVLLPGLFSRRQGRRRQIWGTPGILIHQGFQQVPSLWYQGKWPQSFGPGWQATAWA